MFYSLDKLKPKTKTKNQVFLLLTFRLSYTHCVLFQKRTRKLFSPSKRCFLVSSTLSVQKSCQFLIYTNKKHFGFYFLVLVLVSVYPMNRIVLTKSFHFSSCKNQISYIEQFFVEGLHQETVLLSKVKQYRLLWLQFHHQPQK